MGSARAGVCTRSYQGVTQNYPGGGGGPSLVVMQSGDYEFNMCRYGPHRLKKLLLSSVLIRHHVCLLLTSKQNPPSRQKTVNMSFELTISQSVVYVYLSFTFCSLAALRIILVNSPFLSVT